MKRIISLIMVILVAVSLVSCNAQIESGGKPTPDKVTSGNYEADPEETMLYRIDEKSAKELLGELTPIISQMAIKVYDSDLIYFKKIVNYLSQFNDYEGDLAQYMHSVELLCDAYYDMYVLNCTAKEVKEQIDGYFDTYYKLSEEFKSQYSPFEASDLYAISTRIGILVEEMLTSSEETSSTQSQTQNETSSAVSPN
ncbi:MAG: hypothetical protein IJF58_01025 [Clostridia bacterium]|nr:hypothetical protein [Clostridia bacterium]